MTANSGESALPDVMALLPHRYPFLLLDRVTVLEPGKKAIGIKCVTGSEWFFGEPSGGVAESSQEELRMPNGLVVEALAQLSAALMLDLRDNADSPMLGYFLGIDRVRYRGSARPGDEIELSVELLRFRRGVLRVGGEARVAGVTIVRGELTTVLRPAPAKV